jgi:hypothetical protein
MCTSPHQPPRRARALRLTRVAIATAALLVPAAAHAQAPAPAVPPPVFAVPPADLATLAPPAPPTPPGVVTLHVESPAPLLILESLGLERRVVCTSPCDRVIDGSRGQSFSASGAGGSMTFKLADMRGNVDLLVRPGSSVLRNLGIVCSVVHGEPRGPARGGAPRLRAAQRPGARSLTSRRQAVPACSTCGPGTPGAAAAA